jgi:transposase
MPQRRPLEPIDANRTIKKELTPTQRARISAYKDVGLTNEQIGAKIFRAPTTIAYTLQQNSRRDDFKSLPRSGRPLALLKHERRTILRLVRSNPKITYGVLKQEAGVTVHKSTLYRLLKEEGITN